MADDVSAARRLAARLGRVGVWSFVPDRLNAEQERTFVRAVEGLGFRALWIPEAGQGKEIFSHAGVLLAASERLIVASGIANIWARDPQSMMNGARTLHDAYPGRFVLGLGVSHAPSVARRGRHYERPVHTMRAYLEAMDASPYAAPIPSEPVPRVLAALGPRMLRLAAEHSLGAHPYFVPVEHARRARQEMGADPLLAVEQAVILAPDAATARRVARTHVQRYLGIENYVNNLRRLGWTDADLAGEGSDRLVDAVVAWGGVEEIRQRVEAHLGAGADHVCLQVLEGDGVGSTVEQLRELAPALLAAFPE